MSKEGKICGQWQEQTSSGGKVYYYNATSEISQWEKPQEWKDFEAKEHEKMMNDKPKYQQNAIPAMQPPPIMHPGMGFMGMPPPHFLPFGPHPPGFPPNFPGFFPNPNGPLFPPPPPPKTNPSVVPHFSTAVPPPPMGHPSSRSHNNNNNNNGVPPPPPPVQPPSNDMYPSHPIHDNIASSSSSMGVVPPPPPPSDQSMHSSYVQNRNNRDRSGGDHEHLVSPSTSNSAKTGGGENSIYKREIANLQKNGNNQHQISNKRLSSPSQRINEPLRKKPVEEINKNPKPAVISENEPSTSTAPVVSVVKTRELHHFMTEEMKKLYDPGMAIEKMKELGLHDEEARKEFRKFTTDHMPCEGELNFELAARQCTRRMSQMTTHALEMSKYQLAEVASIIQELSDHRPARVPLFSEIIEMTAK